MRQQRPSFPRVRLPQPSLSFSFPTGAAEARLSLCPHPFPPTSHPSHSFWLNPQPLLTSLTLGTVTDQLRTPCQPLSHPALPPPCSRTLFCLTCPAWQYLLFGDFLPRSRIPPVLVPGRPLHSRHPAFPVPLSLWVRPCALEPSSPPGLAPRFVEGGTLDS